MDDISKFYEEIGKYEASVADSFKFLKKNLYEMISIFDVSKILPQIQDIQHFLILLLDVIRGQLKTNTMAIAFNSLEHPDTYNILGYKGLPEEIKNITFIQNRSKLIKYLGKYKNIVNGSNIMKHINEEDKVKLRAMKAMMLVPLIISNNLRGFFILGPKTKELKYHESDKHFLQFLANISSISIEYFVTLQVIKEKYWNIICILANAIETRYKYLGGHSKEVTMVGLKIAQKMNLSSNEMELISFAGILHDIGNIGIERVILDKPDKLTPKEFELIKKHPELGETILMPIPFFDEIRQVIRQHHERWDGHGYPDKLKGKKISLYARIINIADAFVAMKSNRPYREALSLSQIINEFEKNKGKQYDPEITDILLDLMKQGEIK